MWNAMQDAMVIPNQRTPSGPVNTDLEIHIRAMWPSDMEQVLLIERASFTAAAAWDAEFFLPCFMPGKLLMGFVAEAAGRLVGYAVQWDGEIDALELESIAVLPEFRRRKIGSRFLEHMLERAREMKIKRLRTLIRERNLAAQMFFRASGWRWTKTEKLPWNGLDEDGYRFYKRVLRK
jgi:ribosomal-protein-alanine N-acetyltransferase